MQEIARTLALTELTPNLHIEQRTSLYNENSASLHLHLRDVYLVEQTILPPV